MNDLIQLMDQTREYLHINRYSCSSISHHVTSWKKLRKWYEEKQFAGYDHDVELCYFKEMGLCKEELTKQERAETRHIERLLLIGEMGGFSKQEPKKLFVAPEGFNQACDLYAEELVNRNLKQVTRQAYGSVIRHFCSACGDSSPQQLKMSSLERFTEHISSYAPQSRSNMLYIVRDFVRFLSAKGMCETALAAAMPLIPGHKHTSIPSAYTATEVSCLLKSFSSTRCPKRDNAILLLAVVIGMRAGDIRGLKIRDIDWRTKTVSFIQSKTRNAQVLPMPEEVWLALADYLRHERPAIENNYIFITAYAPYRSFDSSHTFHRSITRAFKNANIDIRGKHHGIHSLRHSVATNMLSNETPYPTISAVLGHSSTNVTRRYLSIDVDSLRCLTLEVPR